MKLYFAPASSYSQRVLIALYEKELSFTPVEVNLFEQISRRKYQKINPFAKIPTLETDNGEIIFEACIIIEYLERRFPQQLPLLNPEQIMEIRMLERIIDVYVNGGREALFADSQRPLELRKGKEVVKKQKLLETACIFLEDKLQNRTWLAGEEFSLADCAAAPTLNYLRLVYDYQHLPNLTNYIQRLEVRPSVVKVQSEGREQMSKMLASLPYPLVLNSSSLVPHS